MDSGEPETGKGGAVEWSRAEDRSESGKNTSSPVGSWRAARNRFEFDENRSCSAVTSRTGNRSKDAKTFSGMKKIKER